MKRAVGFLLAVFLLLSIAGCKKPYKVASPLIYPDYTFENVPNTEQLRETALRAFKDLLMIQWCTDEKFQYKNDGANHKTVFVHEPGVTYGGLPYAVAGSGLFQFLEYYDFETGRLAYEGTADQMKKEIGATCVDSLMWPWTTVCNSIKGGYHPILMVPANGYIPVGNYTIKEKIKSYHEMPTYAITESNGPDVMFDAYSKTLPADVLVSTPDDHGMMVVEKPTVAYLEDGSIDPENSFLIICDQWTGSTNKPDDPVQYRGRINLKFTFAKLLERDYIPLTAAEFIGEKAYEEATVTVNNQNCGTVEGLSTVTVTSNYPLALINILCVDSSGKEILLGKKFFNGISTNGVPRSADLSKITLQEDLIKSGSTIKVEVVTSTGQRFFPIKFKS